MAGQEEEEGGPNVFPPIPRRRHIAALQSRKAKITGCSSFLSRCRMLTSCAAKGRKKRDSLTFFGANSLMKEKEAPGPIKNCSPTSYSNAVKGFKNKSTDFPPLHTFLQGEKGGGGDGVERSHFLSPLPTPLLLLSSPPPSFLMFSPNCKVNPPPPKPRLFFPRTTFALLFLAAQFCGEFFGQICGSLLLMPLSL